LGVERVTRITGTAVPLRGDDIDTDRIIPARFLKAITFENLEAHLFEDDRQQADAQKPGSHPISNPAYAGARIMLVNANFGCGSSREHAPQAIHRRGIQAVIGQSFSEIFFGNSVALGLPCPTASRETLEALMDLVEHDPSTNISVNLESMRISAGGNEYELTLPAGARDAFLSGTWDATGLLRDKPEETAALADRLPYVSGRW
jgi:3-isopropylmalate/(R)-2-methylmalate dehydratase small subunit